MKSKNKIIFFIAFLLLTGFTLSSCSFSQKQDTSNADLQTNISGRGISSPKGSFDLVYNNTCTIAGWTKDPDTNEPIFIHVYKDGPAEKGGIFVKQIGATLVRSDLPFKDKNHGFMYTFLKSSGLFDGKTHKMYIYGIDRTGNQNRLLDRSPKNLTCESANSATFLSQDVPSRMESGKKYTISVTVRNTGKTEWTKNSRYKLGSQNPRDNQIWGFHRVQLTEGEKILPGEEKTFRFEVTAPSIPGTYNFQWQMVEELKEWFGEKTPNREILVEKNIQPQLSYNFGWPGSNAWDMVGWQFENENKWLNEYKPRIIADLMKMYNWHLGEGHSPSARQSLGFVINIPAFVVSDKRIEWQIRRFFEVSRELQAPLSVKIVGYVWWDAQNCPSCPENTGSPWNMSQGKLNYETDVEWWGWSSDYVWAREPLPECSEDDRCLWRNWGGNGFLLTIPHPNFDSPYFLTRVGQKIGVAARTIADEYQKLRSEGKDDLFLSFIPENEVGYGSSYHSFYLNAGKKAEAEFGVRHYIEEHCPDDVLQCLPPKPAEKTREAWIREKSEEFYRPDDFWISQIGGSQKYLAHVSKIGLDAGIPRDKIISQGLSLSYDMKTGDKVVEDLPFFDAALNLYSRPGYSLYANSIQNNVTHKFLRGLKEVRNIDEYTIVEYKDWGGSTDWKKALETIETNFHKLQEKDKPQLKSVIVMNWPDMLQNIEGENPDVPPSVMANDRAAAEFVKNMIKDNIPGEPPIGSFDLAESSTCTISGWAKDPDTTEPIFIHVYKDGLYQKGGTFIQQVQANLTQTDIPFDDKNHGFMYTFLKSSGLFDGKTHKMYIYGIDRTGNQNRLLDRSPKNLTCESANSAAFISQDAPSRMESGKKYTISVTVRNTGKTEWTKNSYYKLGSQNSRDNQIWGFHRVQLTEGEKILPGEEKTFRFEVTAPSTPGTYNFQWQMVEELKEWFGEKTPNREILVEKNMPVPPVAETVKLCLYQKNGKYLTTTRCDPKEQQVRTDDGYTYEKLLGYVYSNDQTIPSGGDVLCIFKHATMGYLTTSACQESSVQTQAQAGYQYLEQLGYVIWNGGEQQEGTIRICRYDHPQKGHLTTTECFDNERAALENQGWKYIWTLGWILSPEAELPKFEGKPLKFNGETIAELQKSSLVDQQLNTKIYYYQSEVTITQITDGTTKYYTLPTAWTFQCKSPLNYLERAIKFDSCNIITRPEALDRVVENGDYYWKQSLEEPIRDWAQGYFGVTSMKLAGTGQNQKVIGVTHGQNNNVCDSDGNVLYHNTVMSPTPTGCSFWGSLSGFASLVWWTLDEYRQGKEGHESGPVAWTPKIYADTPTGPYHPTAFLDGNTYYVYYITDDSAAGGALGKCMTAVRSTIGPDGLPGTFMQYTGNGQFLEPALPQGFKKENIKDFYSIPGPKSACIYESGYLSKHTLWFNVAKIIGTPYYLGVEERVDFIGRTSQILMRISDNPADWSKSGAIVIEEANEPSWGVTHLTYPTFVDKKATTHDFVSPGELFFITGNHVKGGYQHYARGFVLEMVNSSQ